MQNTQEETKTFRYELKYIMDSLQLEEQRMKIGALCDKDPHVGAAGIYSIRSLYFDDYCNSALRDNEIGIEPRSKWRLRTYNHSDQLIHLENKLKEHSKIRKESATVSRKFVEQLLEDPYSLDYPVKDKVINRFLTEYFTRELQPKIIVEYDREPYIWPDGDVRITFDLNICSSTETDCFFDNDLPMRPILGLNNHLMEVKFTEFLPSHLHHALDDGRLRQNTFSKYYLSRTL